MLPLYHVPKAIKQTLKHRSFYFRLGHLNWMKSMKLEKNCLEIQFLIIIESATANSVYLKMWM